MMKPKQDQRQLKRLKDILFPKNKRTQNQSTLNDINPNLFEQKTKRQLNQNKTQIQQHKRSKSKTVKNTLKQQNPLKQQNYSINKNKHSTQINKHSTQINKNSTQMNKHLTQVNTAQEQNQSQASNQIIKHQIDRLKLQINTMLNRWNDQSQLQLKIYSNRNIHDIPSNINELQSHHQQLTRQHYLKNINSISKNLQKYHSYMYGIKQATQSMISTVPLIEENYLIKIEDIRAYKLFYLGKLLLSYFIQKIQIIKKQQLKSAFIKIIDFSQNMEKQRKHQKQRKAINKGNNLFLRKNLLDKAFKKWRTNSALLKFKDTLNEHVNNQISVSDNIKQKDLSIPMKQGNTLNDELKDAQFLGRNILEKQIMVQFLQKYLLAVSEKLSKMQKEVENSKNMNKNKSFYLEQEIQIVFVDSSNRQAFAYINQNNLFSQILPVQVSQSRMQNVLNSITDRNLQSLQTDSNKQINYKRYQFSLKNSLTQMCIDSSKILRIPQIKRNQVFSLQVDGSIKEQLWIRTAKTERGNKNNQKIISNQIKYSIKNPIFKQEVFYQQKSLIQQQGYKYECPSIKTSAIFYPLIHQNNLMGMVRQYIYHSQQVSLPSIQIAYENLEYVSQSIFTSFQLSYSFESLKKQRMLIDEGYALKVVRMVKKMDNEVKRILNAVQDEDISEDEINEKLMQVFQKQMEKILSNRAKPNQKDIIKDKGYQCWDMKVHKLLNRNISNNQNQDNQRKSKLLVCVDEGQQKVQFQRLFESVKRQQNKVDEEGLINLLVEFHEDSINKQSNILVSNISVSKQQQTKVVLIKGNGLFFSFVCQQNKITPQKNRKQSISNKREQLILPPSQLLVDIVNKFVYILNSTIDKRRQVKYGLKQKSIVQRQMKKSNIKQKMREFYLDSLKDCAISIYNYEGNDQQKRLQKQRQTQTYLSKINGFISGCVDRMFKQLADNIEVDLNQQKLAINFRVQYKLKIKVPYCKEQSQLSYQNITLKVVLNFTNTNTNKQHQLVSHNKNVQKCDINYQIINEDINQQSNSNGNESNLNQGIVNLQLNQISVGVQTILFNNQSISNNKQLVSNNKQSISNSNQWISNNKQSVSNRSQSKSNNNEWISNRSQVQDCILFNNNEIEQILKETINSYFQITQKVYFQTNHKLYSNETLNNKTINHTNQVNNNKQTLSNNQSPLTSKLTKLTPQIKHKIFQLYLNHQSLSQSQYQSQSQSKNQSYSQSKNQSQSKSKNQSYYQFQNKQLPLNNRQKQFLDVVNNVLRSILVSQIIDINQNNKIDFIFNRQNINQILQEQSFKQIVNNQLSQQTQIDCKYYQFLTNQTLQLLQNTLGTLNHSNTLNTLINPVDNKYKESLFIQVISKLKSYGFYNNRLNQHIKINSTKHIKINNTVNLSDQNEFNEIIRSSCFILSIYNKDGITTLPLIAIKINNKNINSLNKQNISSISNYLSTITQSIFKQYKSINKYLYAINKLNKTIQALTNMTQTKSNLPYQINTINNSETILINHNNDWQQILNPISQNQSIQQLEQIQYPFIYQNLSFAFNQIKSYSQHIKTKANRLIQLSFLNQKLTNKLLTNSIKHWQSVTTHISNSQFTHILKDKIVNNLQQSQYKINLLVNKIGSICCYDKVLNWALYKLTFYARHQRIADFHSYRLKFLDSALLKLKQKQIQINRIEMKKFFNLGSDIVFEKRKQQILTQKRLSLFMLKVQKSKMLRKQIRQSYKEGFNKIKMTGLCNKQVKQVQIQLNVQKGNKSLDEQLSQSNSLQQIRNILNKEYPQYDIWVKPNKNIDQFIILSISTQQLNQNNCTKNLSLDNSSIVPQKLNQNLMQMALNNQKISKDDVLNLYFNNEQYTNLQTPNAIFIFRDINLHYSQSLISSQSNLASFVVNLSSNSTQLSFKQKEKLHSLSKCLAQFFTHYKTQLNIKILHLQSLYQTLKTKKYLQTMKRWKKYDQDLLLMKTYQLTDHVYELNIETDNIKQKIKQQDKQINQNQSQYNKLIKKQQEQKQKIQKYQNNIEVLNKILQYYHQIQKKQNDLLKSASKSSKKFSKISLQTPIVDLSTLSHEEINVVLLSLTRWRQINANQKLKQLRINNFKKQIKILDRSLIQSTKIIKSNFKKQAFHHIFSYSLKVKQQIYKKQEQQRNRIIKIQIQNQRLQKQNAQRLKLEKEKMQKQQKERISRIDTERMQQLFRNSAIKSMKEFKGDRNCTWQSQKLTGTQKSLTLGQKSTYENSKVEVSRNISQNQTKTLPQNTYYSSNDYQTQEDEFYTPKQTATQSLADQLESSFSELNRRLVTFQKNHLSPSQLNDDQLEPQTYQKKCEVSQIERQPVNMKKIQVCPLQISNPPNDSVNLVPQMEKMTQQEKIKFELQRMRMKKLHFNKENLTVTQQQYERLNGGNGYKLGGKTLRFLKRMGKLQTTQRENK